jgi:hypothetical protein
MAEGEKGSEEMNEEDDNAENSLTVTVHYTVIDLDWITPSPWNHDENE